MNINLYPNWFEQVALPYFETFRSVIDNTQPVRALQIGAYVGHASNWIADAWLRHSDSLLVDVDTWKGSDEDAHRALNWNEVLLDYLDNTSRHDTKIQPYRMTSDAFFMGFKMGSLFDFIYIDGDHTREQVYRDAVNAWEFLKPGAIMAFDDYEWGEGMPMHLRPRDAINQFLGERTDYKTLAIGWQVWVQKNADATT